MNDNFPYLDLIVLGMVAGFILLRLRSILGQNTGFDGTAAPKAPTTATPPKRDDLVVQMANKFKPAKIDAKTQAEPLFESLDASSKQAVETLKKVDSQFTLQQFINGAKGAFEMVFDAYLNNDKATLQNLLSPELAKTFVEEAEKRKTGDRITETTLVAVESMEIKSVAFNTPVARITVHFISEQVTVVRDSKGAIIEGDASHIERVEDEWTFERATNSRSPNWTIIDT